MNLSQMQGQQPAPKTAEPSHAGTDTKSQIKAEEQSRQNELLDVLNNATTESAFWDRNRPLENCDVVGCVVKRFVFEGKEQNFDNGNPKWEFMLKLIEPNGIEKYVSCVVWTKIYKAIAKAMLDFDISYQKFAQVVGLNISIECTGKEGNAYTYAAKVNGTAKRDVEGIFDKDGNQIA